MPMAFEQARLRSSKYYCEQQLCLIFKPMYYAKKTNRIANFNTDIGFLYVTTALITFK